MALEIDEDFLASVKDRPLEAVLDIDDEIRYMMESGTQWSHSEYEFLLNAFALVRTLGRESLIDFKLLVDVPRVTGDPDTDCNPIAAFISRVAEPLRKQVAQAKLERIERSMALSIGVGFAYEFSQGDLDRVQLLINELRELISASERFEAKHQRRLLMRLEKLQSELHKRMSDLDNLWGLVGDAGVAVGRFGKDAKPIFDRIREITNITWRTQARAEELPTDAPFPQLEDHASELDDQGA